MTDIVNALVPQGGVNLFALKSLLVDPLQTGLHVVQVCVDPVPRVFLQTSF